MNYWAELVSINNPEILRMETLSGCLWTIFSDFRVVQIVVFPSAIAAICILPLSHKSRILCMYEPVINVSDFFSIFLLHSSAFF